MLLLYSAQLPLFALWDMEAKREPLINGNYNVAWLANLHTVLVVLVFKQRMLLIAMTSRFALAN